MFFLADVGRVLVDSRSFSGMLGLGALLLKHRYLEIATILFILLLNTFLPFVDHAMFDFCGADEGQFACREGYHRKRFLLLAM